MRVRTPVPSRVDDQSILLPLKLSPPMPVNAAVIKIVPVPVFSVKSLPAPAIALATVIVPLLALLFRVRFELSAKEVLESPNVIYPAPAVLLLVVIVPPKLNEDGLKGTKEPPE